MPRLPAFLLLAMLLVLAPRPAPALTLECRDVTAFGGFAEQFGKMRQFGRKLLQARRADTDIVRLLSNSTRVNRNDMQAVWGGLMCRATRDGDPAATRLRNRWSEAIGRRTDGFTIARAEDFFLDRLKVAPRDETRLLSGGERQLLADTLAYMAEQGDPYPAIRRALTGRLGLPPPSPEYGAEL